MPSQKQLLQVISIQKSLAEQGHDITSIMELVAKECLSLLDADGASVEMAEGEDMVYKAVSGLAEGHLGMRLKIKESLSGLCFANGQVLTSEDTDIDPLVNREACREIGLRSMLLLPLVHKGICVGVLKIMRKVACKFSSDDIELLKLMSNLIGSMMYFSTHDRGVEEILFNATHDSLTRLANRTLFVNSLRDNLRRRLAANEGVGILMMDLDGFKQINDNYGHLAGDAVLVEFSRRVCESVRASDVVSRLGGDEFAVILGCVELDGGMHRAIDRIQDSLEEPFVWEGKAIDIHASIGGALHPVDGSTRETLIGLADRRMYEMKRDRQKGNSSLLLSD